MGLDKIPPERAYAIRSQGGKAASAARQLYVRRYCNKGHEQTAVNSHLYYRRKLSMRNGKYYDHVEHVCRTCQNIRQTQRRRTKRREEQQRGEV